MVEPHRKLEDERRREPAKTPEDAHVGLHTDDDGFADGTAAEAAAKEGGEGKGAPDAA